MERKLGRVVQGLCKKDNKKVTDAFFKWAKENPAQFIGALPITGGSLSL